MKKIKKSKRFSDYNRVDLGDTITFGTTLFIRKDNKALKIVFPCGNILDFKPLEENDKPQI
jgi:hypothetical protein